MSLLIKCIDCPNEMEVDLSRGVRKKICDDCLKVRHRNSMNIKNRKYKSKRHYAKVFTNLTKNYILFVEGIRK